MLYLNMYQSFLIMHTAGLTVWINVKHLFSNELMINKFVSVINKQYMSTCKVATDTAESKMGRREKYLARTNGN